MRFFESLLGFVPTPPPPELRGSPSLAPRDCTTAVVAFFSSEADTALKLASTRGLFSFRSWIFSVQSVMDLLINLGARGPLLASPRRRRPALCLFLSPPEGPTCFLSSAATEGTARAVAFVAGFASAELAEPLRLASALSFALLSDR